MNNHLHSLGRCFAITFAAMALVACKNDKTEGGGTDWVTPAASTAQGLAGGGKTPPDGKYENVVVEGRAVPMINVMNGGTVVLVDTDGKKPRDWEEQFKRKGSVPGDAYNLHKTNVNHNEAFDDDPIDREGLWTMDEKGNITKR